MRLISIGDLVADFYYKNNKLLGINGGMSSQNIILNLANKGYNTKTIGCCGNDILGRLSIKSLSDNDVDVKDIAVHDSYKTRCFFISFTGNDENYSISSKKRCPICNQKSWYDKSLIIPEQVIKLLNPDDILIFDNLNSANQKIINETDNLKLIDLGQYKEFEQLTNEDLIDKLNNKFEIVNLNKRVADYFIKRLNFRKLEDISKIFNASLILITNGEHGATFIYKENKYEYKPKNITKAIDPTGAGDAFFSSIIDSWIKNDFKYDINLFDKWYSDSVKLTSKVVKKIGARSHIIKLYKIKKIKNKCSCEDFEISVRKKVKRCNININNLQTRIINGINSSAINEFESINFNENENYLFVGTGGSFAAAAAAAKITNHYVGCNSLALLPRDVLNRNNKNISKVFLFSYSGTTNDLIEAAKNFANANKYLITKGEKNKITSKTDYLKENIMSYRTANNKGKEKGFLSFEGAIVPAFIFLKHFEKNLDIDSFINNSIDYWNSFLTKEFKKEDVKKVFLDRDLLNIFWGDYSSCAEIDFESKIVESGIYNCISHEKKNFSHGRFVNYENKNNRNSVYFKQKNTDEYEKLLLNYLKNGNTLLLESKYNGILAEVDLLIASQYLVYYIGNLLDIDMSKPKYSEDAMKIYFYKGNL